MHALELLSGRGCPVRPAGPGDAVDGVAAAVVAAPTSTAEVAAALRACHERGLAVVVRGGGTKLGWARPPARLDAILDTGALDRVVDHAAGDLIVAAGAGLRLADLNATLAAHRQQLLVDDVAGGCTLGGMVATGMCGPRRLAAGAPRDLLIGVEFVRADGVVARAGGRVVKNVAGYDIGKLLAGSYGTLAVITEVTFRLHPVPESARWVTAGVPLAALGEVLAGVLAAQLVPAAIEVDHPGGDGPARVAVLLTGTPAGVAARATAAAALLGGGEVDGDADWTSSYPWAGNEASVATRIAVRLSAVAATVSGCAAAGVPVRGSAGVGVLYADLSGAEDPAATLGRLRTGAVRDGGSAVLLDAPAPLKAGLDTWGPVGGLEWMRRVKREFDPSGVLAPGRFVGGI